MMATSLILFAEVRRIEIIRSVKPLTSKVKRGPNRLTYSFFTYFAGWPLASSEILILIGEENSTETEKDPGIDPRRKMTPALNKNRSLFSRRHLTGNDTALV